MRRTGVILAAVAGLSLAYGVFVAPGSVVVASRNDIPRWVRPMIEVIPVILSILSEARERTPYPVLCTWKFAGRPERSESTDFSCEFPDVGSRPAAAEKLTATQIVRSAKAGEFFVDQFCSMGVRNVLLRLRDVNAPLIIPPEIVGSTEESTRGLRCVSIRLVGTPESCVCDPIIAGESCQAETFTCQVRGAIFE